MRSAVKSLTGTIKRDEAPTHERSADIPRWVAPGFAPLVTASPEEVRYAQELRDALKQRYLNRARPRVSWWSVGVD